MATPIKTNKRVALVINSKSELAEIQKILEAFGFRESYILGIAVSSWCPSYDNGETVVFIDKDNTICWQFKTVFERSVGNFATDKLGILLKSIVSNIDYLKDMPEPIIIGSHQLEFKKDGIQVGCTFVHNKTIIEIAKRQNLFNKK